MQKISEFIAKYRVTMSTTVPTERPRQLGDWAVNYWVCTLRCQGRTLVTPFGGGSAVTEPEVESVLSSLATDSASFDNSRDIFDWASELGYDLDEPSTHEEVRSNYAAAAGSSALLRDFLAGVRPVNADEDAGERRRGLGGRPLRGAALRDRGVLIMEFRHRPFHGKDIFVLCGFDGAAEWRGTDTIKVHLHYGSNPHPLSAEDIAEGVYEDEGCKCDYVAGGRCWIDPVTIEPEQELEFLTGDHDRARQVLAVYYEVYLEGMRR